MFQVKRLVERLRSDEGFRSAPYRCSAGVWTVGFGTTAINGAPVTPDTAPVGLQEALIYLKADLVDAIEDCQAIYGWVFEQMRSVQQEVLICLAYQLGRDGLRGFAKMNKAIMAHDQDGWIEELLDSKLARVQAPKRVARYVEAITTLVWPPLHDFK